MTNQPASSGRREALADRLFHATIGALDVLHLYLGDKLGLYEALTGGEPMTPSELAERAGVAPRYAREWLEQQACGGYLDVAEDAGDPETRRYRIPDGAAEVYCEPESLHLLAPMGQSLVGAAQALPRVLEAFRSGGGVPFEAYGEEMREGVERLNRPAFTHQLGPEWIPALPDIEERLRRVTPPAHVADLGCGSGWSTLAIAQAYPHTLVDGIDSDAASIAAAARRAQEHDVADRVTFRRRDAADPVATGRYDLVTIFEALHDMAHPVQALSAALAMLADGGAVLVADERVGERFTAPGPDIDRYNYGWSALVCLAAALTEPDSAATGAVMRPDTLRKYAAEAGFGAVTVLPIEHDFWRFYRLDP